jgi:hypothetical protein
MRNSIKINRLGRYALARSDAKPNSTFADRARASQTAKEASHGSVFFTARLLDGDTNRAV